MKYTLKQLTEAFVKHVEYHHQGIIFAKSDGPEEDPVVEHDSTECGDEYQKTTPVDAGGDDAAAIAVIARCIDEADDCKGWVNEARAILAAIRAGKVPNIVDATVLSDERGLLAGQYAEIAALRARVAELENADADPTFTGLLGVLGQVVGDHGDSEGGVECCRRIVKERDRATSELERQARMLREATDERDRALADLAAGRERAEGLRAKIVWGFYENVAPEYAQGKAGENEICDILTAKEANDLVQRAVRVEKERDAARAEVAALKARKVRRPNYETATPCNPARIDALWADNIRSAGVEVES